MTASALRRVKAFLAHARGEDSAVWLYASSGKLPASDLRALVTLAEQADELRARVRLARAQLSREFSFGMEYGRDVLALLDIRKPLRKPGRGRK